MYLRNSILATLAYYDILDMPLTLIELHKLLINPARVNNHPGPIGEIGLGDVEKKLENLISLKLVDSKNGFFFLAGKEKLYGLRIEKNKVSVGKWKKFLRLAKYFQSVPYLKAVFASGSLAAENTIPESDFDVLIITKPGRLYTCRIFLSAVASFFGARRKRYDRIAPDKFCFNHYLTSDNLCLVHESLFNAQTYAALNPCLAEPETADKFFASNLWLNKYLYNFRPPKEFVKRSIKPSPTLKLVARAGEFLLDSFLGGWLESIFKKYQQRRIRRNPATWQSGGRVIFTDTELEFHPRSFEASLTDRYNKKLEALGIVTPFKEKDSGLN